MQWTEANVQGTPSVTGVYELSNASQTILYVGRSIRLRERLLEHWNLGDIPGVVFFAWHQTDSEQSAANIEADWISRFEPRYNIQGR